MMDAEYSELNGKYESSTYVTVFGDIDLIQVQDMFYDSACGWSHSTVQSSGYQQNPMDVNI